MSEHHHHHHDVSGKNLFLTIVLNIIITLSQIVGGIYSGSFALLSDAFDIEHTTFQCEYARDDNKKIVI